MKRIRLEKLVRVVISAIQRVLGDNVVASAFFGSICFPEEYVPNLSDINVCVITKEVVRDLYLAIFKLKTLCWERTKLHFSFAIYPERLFREFYFEGIPIAILVAHSCQYILGGNYLSDLKKKPYGYGTLAINYSLCSSFTAISLAIEKYLSQIHAEAIRHAYHSARHSLRALIHHETKKFPLNDKEILKTLEKLGDKDLVATYKVFMIHKKKALLIQSKVRKKLKVSSPSIHKLPLDALLIENITSKLIYKAYELVRDVWKKIHGASLKSLDYIIKRSITLNALEISLRCQDDKPILEIFDGEETHTIPLTL